jgi:uncharacterized membrane protein
MMQPAASHLRFHLPHGHLASPFGAGRFGAFSERTPRFLGTPQYLLSQSAVVAAWIVVNALAGSPWDPYPFILLNLAFSTQAAYAAPMILLAQTRQADRDKRWTESDAEHREAIARTTLDLLEQNTELTRQVKALSERVHELTEEIHGRVVV